MGHNLRRVRYLVSAGIVLMAAVFFLAACQNPQRLATPDQITPDQAASSTPKPNLPGTETATPQGVLSEMNGQTPQVSIQLSESQAQPQTAVPNPLATGEPLRQDEIDQILARLPTLESEVQVDFKLAQGPIPPPRTGSKVVESFPPAPAAVPTTQVESGPLKVLRYAPEGEISIAPFINITFDQPMVPLATLEELSAAQVPVQIEPPLPGTWRWLGTRTLNFQYDSKLIDRLPKATTFKVTIPAGTTSATGGKLAETVAFSFTTPPPKVQFTYPPSGVPQSREPVFFISFDQRIDPAAVLPTIHVAAGNQPVSVELVGEDKIKADEKVNWLLKNSIAGRWIAFRAKETLPADATISVVIGPGTPSAEGPMLTQEAQSYSFLTYAPLRIMQSGCSWGGADSCPPLSPFYIGFNNPIDTKIYSDSMVHIQPELPGASISVYGNNLNIQGTTKGQTTYQVTIDANIQDIFGQKLGKDVTLTFRVGSAEPVLFGPNDPLITLDPAAAKPIFSVYTINYSRLNVKIYAVQPSDWPAYKQYLRDYQRTDIKVTVPGRLVQDKTIRVDAPADTLSQVDIDLSPAMDGNFGQLIVVVEPPRNLFQLNPNRYQPVVRAWVQITQIGLDAFNDHSEMVVWTTALKNGAPLSGVTVEAAPTGQQVTTNSDGTVRFAIPNSTAYLVARQGTDVAMLPRSSYWGDDAWNPSQVSDMLRWYVFDDRQMYRPGEEVHMKGWLRRIGGKQDGDVGLVGSAVTHVNYQVNGPQGNALGSGRVEVNPLGGFDITFTLPQSTNLGYANVSLSAEGSLAGLGGEQNNHGFQIQEFRRPEFEVTARNETSGPYFAGDHAVVAVDAKYYAGGPLANADVTWQISSSPSSYSPPNWPDFIFGSWTPWWWGEEPVYSSKVFAPGRGFGGAKVETFTGKTDSSGTHLLRLDFDITGTPKPVSVLAEAKVMDVNRQVWAGTTTLLVHPADLYVGLRSKRVFVERGTPLKVDFIVTDLDGKPVIDRPVEVQAARLEWKLRNGSWQEEAADIQTCKEGSTLKPVTCTFETKEGGSYRITALVTDQSGRQNQSQFTRWVSGGKLPPARKVEQEKVTLIPDKDSYQPGDVAQILVQAPFSPAEGLLTMSRSGILSTQRFRIEDSTITLKVPIEEKFIPNLNIQVDVNGAAPRSSDQGEILSDVPPRPAFASGQLNLQIPPTQRTLTLQVTPAAKELAPGEETSLDVSLKDAAGKPVPDAEMAVVVVDEAILALSNYQLTDPLNVFYSNRESFLTSLYGRTSIILADPQALAQAARNEQAAGAVMKAVPAPQATMAAEAAAPMAPALADSGAAPQEPISVRTNFNPLAVFAPTVHTDANGEARIAVKLPDNLTRYRIMVVAVDQGRQFGTGESSLVARLPLMVRPSAPRFLNFGDQFELPVVLQNQTDQPLTVDVAIRATNLEITGNQGLRVTIPSRDRLEVRFPAAAQKAGTARFQIAATAGSYVDAASIALPVYTPATTEAFATYGVIDEGAIAQPVSSPGGVFPQYGGLEITTSSTALQSLTDAVLYLVSYPYECSEQLSSRILAVAALRDVLTAFNAAELPSPQAMEAAVDRDITRLQGMQNGDGGFPSWRRGQDSVPFNTIHVTHALYRASSKGFTVPAEMQQRALEYLRQIENYYPTWYSQRTRQTLSAYALYVRNLMGDRDPTKAVGLLNESGLEKLPMDAVGWLWPVLQDSQLTGLQLDNIRRYVNNRAVETAGAANFTTDYDEQNYLLLGSDRRTDAILLDALIDDSPKNDLIPKVVNGLLAHRTRGRWTNTQENVFVLLALDHYFNTFEAQTPDFVAQLWLGETYAGSSTFKGRTTERHETNIPMAYLLDQSKGAGETQNLILNKDGPGRLYYRLGLRYAPTNLTIDPLDMGFVVQRTYEAVDNPSDVSKDENGVWHVKAGAQVRVRLNMVADNRRYHVALTDPLPAGLEIVNSALSVSGSIPQDPNSPGYRYGWWWGGSWFEHQNLRDERAEAFTSLLWDGVYQYSYVARATTPGRFVVPPAKAEEMYSPEVFGRSGSDVVIVE
jgi:alpha-2-macroglobulin